MLLAGNLVTPYFNTHILFNTHSTIYLVLEILGFPTAYNYQHQEQESFFSTITDGPCPYGTVESGLDPSFITCSN